MFNERSVKNNWTSVKLYWISVIRTFTENRAAEQVTLKYVCREIDSLENHLNHNQQLLYSNAWWRHEKNVLFQSSQTNTKLAKYCCIYTPPVLWLCVRTATHKSVPKRVLMFKVRFKHKFEHMYSTCVPCETKWEAIVQKRTFSNNDWQFGTNRLPIRTSLRVSFSVCVRIDFRFVLLYVHKFSTWVLFGTEYGSKHGYSDVWRLMFNTSARKRTEVKHVSSLWEDCSLFQIWLVLLFSSSLDGRKRRREWWALLEESW